MSAPRFPTDPINLSEAPEAFLDLVLWEDFLNRHPSREEALRNLAPHPAENLLRADMSEADYHLQFPAAGLFSCFQKSLVSGEILATGLNASGERKDILPELWTNLKIDFFDNRASDGSLVFTHIQVRAKPASDAQMEEYVQYLKSQREEAGHSNRAFLESAFLLHFPSARWKDFDAAYSAAFRKKVGRPRLSQNNQ